MNTDDQNNSADDLVTPFHLEGQPVRGRIVRLGPALDEILQAHNLSDPVARLLGEAVLSAILAGSSLKFTGRVIVQASGNGPVSFLVSDFTTDGGVRGYIRADKEQLPDETAPELKSLMGDGQFALTIDPGKAEHRYQGIAKLEPSSFAATAETYFKQSEQIPSRLILAVSRHTDGDGITRWRGGGILAQRIADDRDDAEHDPWQTALSLLETVSADELTDPMLTTKRLLYRLFHEQGVRTFEPLPIYKRCTCTPEHVKGVLRNFTRAEVKQMITKDEQIEMTCEYCSKTFCFAASELNQNL